MNIEFAPDDWGLYVHIPFCRARCTYCDFNTVTHMGEDQHRQYLGAVAREWQSAKLPTGRLISVFFGGGTPSLVHPSLIAGFLDALRDRIGPIEDVEITLESNPGTLDPNRLDAFRQAGVNRLSVGAQAMQEDHLKALNRIHGVEDIYSAVEFARQAKFSNLNLDAIYGLPNQTLNQWQETLSKLIELGPEHFSLYHLQVEEGTSMAIGVAQGGLHLPQEDIVADMADLALTMLNAAGYEPYEISNWARSGHESLHNQLYWTMNSYIGLGAGAHSFHNNRRWWNFRGVRRYMMMQGAGESTVEGEEQLSVSEQMREYMWLGLRRRAGISKDGFAIKFRRTVEDVFQVPLAKLVDLGLVVNGEHRIWLSHRGWEMANYVFRIFLDSGMG